MIFQKISITDYLKDQFFETLEDESQETSTAESSEKLLNRKYLPNKSNYL